MADWVDIDNTTIEPDAPLISSTMFALRDNPKAMAEGAPGAPRVEESAMAPASISIDKAASVTAGDVTRFAADDEVNTASTSFVTVVDETLANSGTSLRVTLNHRVTAGVATDRESEARVLRNGNVVASWKTTSTSDVSRSVDFGFSQGDRIRIQHRETSGDAGNSHISNMRFRTSGQGLWPGRGGYVY